MAEIEGQIEFPIVIDRIAIEELGLTVDAPVDGTFPRLSLRAVLRLLLRDFDLTYLFRDEVILITSVDAASELLRTRVHWLEGTGVPRGDFDSIMEAIQVTIHPDTWESLGGPSTMVPLQRGPGGRFSLLVSTADEVHHEIAALLEVLRQSQTAPDPAAQGLEPSLAPPPPNAADGDQDG